MSEPSAMRTSQQHATHARRMSVHMVIQLSIQTCACCCTCLWTYVYACVPTFVDDIGVPVSSIHMSIHIDKDIDTHAHTDVDIVQRTCLYTCA